VAHEGSRGRAKAAIVAHRGLHNCPNEMKALGEAKKILGI